MPSSPIRHSNNYIQKQAADGANPSGCLLLCYPAEISSLMRRRAFFSSRLTCA